MRRPCPPTRVPLSAAARLWRRRRCRRSRRLGAAAGTAARAPARRCGARATLRRRRHCHRRSRSPPSPLTPLAPLLHPPASRLQRLFICGRRRCQGRHETWLRRSPPIASQSCPPRHSAWWWRREPAIRPPGRASSPQLRSSTANGCRRRPHRRRGRPQRPRSARARLKLMRRHRRLGPPAPYGLIRRLLRHQRAAPQPHPLRSRSPQRDRPLPPYWDAWSACRAGTWWDQSL